MAESILARKPTFIMHRAMLTQVRALTRWMQRAESCCGVHLATFFTQHQLPTTARSLSTVTIPCLLWTVPDGKILWNYTTNGVIVSAPTVANGVLCVSSYDNTLYALNTLDGSRIWSIKSDNGFSGNTIVNGVVYADSGDGKMNAYNAATGNKLWSQNTSPPEFSWVNQSSCSTPTYYAGALYFTGRSEQSLKQAGVGIRGVSFSYDKTYVYALNVDNHNKMWNFTADSFQLGNPVEASQGVVYTEDNQRILGFNAQNGALVWNYTNADLWPSSQPTVTNGYFYLGFSDGQLYAIRSPATGSQPGNQNTTFFDEVKNSILLIIIIVNIAVTMTLLIIYRRSKKIRSY